MVVMRGSIIVMPWMSTSSALQTDGAVEVRRAAAAHSANALLRKGPSFIATHLYSSMARWSPRKKSKSSPRAPAPADLPAPRNAAQRSAVGLLPYDLHRGDAERPLR
jgi:hypothetical protein